MKRIHVVLAALAIVVTSLAAFAGPAMADDLDCRDASGELISCDGELYTPYDDNNSYYYDYPLFSDYPLYNADPYYSDSYYNEDEYEDYLDEYEDYIEDHEDSYWMDNYYW